MGVVDTLLLRWHRLRDRFLDLLFPPRCVGCRRVGAWLCEQCLDQLSPVSSPNCVRCGDKVDGGELCERCRVSPLRIERIRSVLFFEGVLRDAMHHLKYRRRQALAEPLGEVMAAFWMQSPVPVDVLVPVPLHKSRLRERGYNQAALLARQMARRTGLPVDESLLARQRATASQVTLGAAQRRENVRGAFVCPGDAPVDKQILLIDDVCTTGATLEACAQALYQAGARSVQALTLARAC